MTIDAVSEMTNNALYVIIKVSLPVLLVSHRRFFNGTTTQRYHQC